MNTTTNTVPGAGELVGLRALHLSDADLQALGQQGFLAREFRGGRGPFFKLRFRRDGRQAVRYVGTDPVRAEQIRLELQQLQRPRRLERELARLLAEARQGLQKAKLRLAPELAALGLYYHGYELRRRAEPRRRHGQPSPAGPKSPERPDTVTPANTLEGIAHER